MATVPDIHSSAERTPLSVLQQRPWIVLIFVAAVAFVLYCGTLSFEFVWDDGDQIINNPLIRSWHSIPRIFGSDLWFHTIHNQVYYRPLFLVWEILNLKIFGANPRGWHLGTILLHVLASCAVYWLGRGLRLDHWTAALAALIFGVHPIHVECASWISAGSDSMVAILYMLSFVAYLKYRDSETAKRRVWQVLSMFLLACALFTKEMAITFALLVAVYEWLDQGHASAPLFSRIRTSITAALPYAIITVGYLVARRMALHGSAAFDLAHTNLDVLLTLPLILFTYLKLLLVPKGLTPAYYIPYVTSLSLRTFVLPALALLTVTTIVWFWRRRRGDLKIGFLVAWLVLGLIPVLYLRTFAPGAGVRDRYMYLPSVGFALLLAVAIRSIRLRSQATSPSVQMAVTAVFAIAFFVGSLSQQIYWANDFLLFYRACSLYPHNSESMAINLADALIKKRQYGRAIPILKQVVHENPNSGTPHAVLAQAYLRVGQPVDARRELEEALRIAPELLSALKGMTDVANVYGELGDYQKAIPLYERVLHKEPDFYDALYNGGLTYFLMGDNDRAEKLLSHAIHVAPGLDAPVFYLGRIYLRKAQPELAEANFKQALEINPKGYGLHYWLGQALAARGRADQARDAYAEELTLHPANADAIAQLNRVSTAPQPKLENK
jgi:Tfp pilus assembly protein PilF